MVNDTISDMLTRIRNANLVKSQNVFLPLTRISQQLCQILEKEGFIHSYQVTTSGILIRLKYIGREKKPCITNLRRISKPGLRIYTNYKEIPLILNGMGIIILSTPKGLMTDKDARTKKIGGEILCSLW
uniref:Small ribosomal subunit protein uS8c n=1 Tax=Geminella minor TaxID=163309 RepID=A0A097KQ27_GEMMI|nr:ribosomal protein S8 [Geminella minor]AIT95293.1 ribosomal protein S8 [Geminella minor]